MKRQRIKREIKPSGKREGRPSKYDPEIHPRQVLVLSKLGYSPNKIANKLGLIKSNLFDWAKAHPEFSYAFNMGRQECEEWWVDLGLDNINTKDFKIPIWSKIMCNYFHWRGDNNPEIVIPPKIEHEHKFTLDISKITHDELKFLKAIYDRQKQLPEPIDVVHTRGSGQGVGTERVKRIR